MNTIAENQGLSSQFWLYLDTVIIDFDNYDNTADILNAAFTVLLGGESDEIKPNSG